MSYPDTMFVENDLNLAFIKDDKLDEIQMTKKTETIEVRVSPELKSQLSAICKDRGQPMSHAIRRLIQMEISNFSHPSTATEIGTMRRLKPSRLRDFGVASISVITLATLWTMFAPSLSNAQSFEALVFAEMDLNKDGVVTKEEFHASAPRILEGDIEEENVPEQEPLPAVCETDFSAIFADDEEIDAASMDSDFQEFDLNKDGKILFGEVQRVVNQEMLAEFTDIDADQNGFLSETEFTSDNAVPELKDLTGLSSACSEALAAQGVDIEGMIATELQLEFAELDENDDAKISQEEFFSE